MMDCEMTLTWMMIQMEWKMLTKLCFGHLDSILNQLIHGIMMILEAAKVLLIQQILKPALMQSMKMTIPIIAQIRIGISLRKRMEILLTGIQTMMASWMKMIKYLLELH